VDEILLTEKSYNESLSTCIEVFMKPINESNPPLISLENELAIFGNIENIAKVHKNFLQEIKNRVDKYYPNICIADVFVTFIPQFQDKCYSEYIKNYERGIIAQSKCIAEIPEFDQFTKKCRLNPRCNSLGLSDFLIMPIQRLPRFELLLTDYLRNIDVDHPDYSNAKKALKYIKEIASFVNEEKRKADHFQRTLALQKNIKGKKFSLMQPGRELTKEGSLIQIVGTKEKEIYVFIFKDMMVITKRKSNKGLAESEFEFKRQIKGSDLSFDILSPGITPISPKKSASLSNQETLKLVDKSKNEVLILKFLSAAEKKKWMIDIHNCMENSNTQLP